MSTATINDVARAAGVSVSTVSYAISGARPIRPDKLALMPYLARLARRPAARAYP